MCSRYELSVNAAELKAMLARLLGAPPALPPGLADTAAVVPTAVVRPTDRAPVVLVDNQGAIVVARVPWGWPAPWDGSPLFNARIERLDEAPSFRPHLGRRCLVPATAWLEGRGQGRMRLRLADGGLVLMAGLYGRDAAGHPAFTVITRPAAPAIAHIHPRMPVLVNEDEAADSRAHRFAGLWLDPSTDAVEALARLAALPPPALIARAATDAAPATPDLFGAAPGGQIS